MAGSLHQALDQADTRQVLTECAACNMQIKHIYPECEVTHSIKVLAHAHANTG